MKKILAFLLAVSMILAMAACAAAPAQTTTEPAKTEETPATENTATEAPAETEAAAPVEEENLTETQKIIKEAEGMTLEELAKKAIEESNGKMFYGVGNSSRGKSALPLFIEYLQSIDSSYNMEFEWQQPKNNKIFDQLTADSLKDTGTFAENLDGKQLESSGAVLSYVAGGQAVVGVTLEETASRRIAAGDELAMVYPADGTSCVPDGCAILNGAPHADNARAFVDFTVSRDVQQLIQEQFCRRSVRSDLEPAGELPSFGRIAQVDYDVSLASENRESVLMSWAFYQETEETP